MRIDRAVARRLWPARAPWQATLLVGAILLIGVLMSSEVERPPLGSFTYYAVGVGGTLLVGGAVLLLVLPAMGTTVLLVGALLTTAAPDTDALFGLVLAAVAAAFLGRLLIARRADPFAAAPRASIDEVYDGSFAARRPWLGIALAATAAVACIGLIITHQWLLADDAAFEARAERHTATVLTVDEEWLLTLQVDDRVIEIDAPAESEHTAGDAVDILVDPEDPDRIRLAASLGDPSWALGLAILAIPLGGFAVWRLAFVGTRRRRLVDGGGPAASARLVTIEDGTYLIPTDTAWPAVALTSLGQLLPEGFEEETEEEPDDADEPEPTSEWPDTVEELRAFLSEEDEIDAEDGAWLEALFGPEAPRPLTVMVIGVPRPGTSIGIRHGARTWLGEVTAEAMDLRARGRLRRVVGGGTPDGMLDTFVDFHPQAARLLMAAFGVALVSALLLLMLADDEVTWLRALGFAAIWAASSLGFAVASGRATLRPDRLILYGHVFDEVIPPHRVLFLAAGEKVVGLRLRDPDGLVSLEPSAVLRRPDATVDEALAALERWRLDAKQARGSRRLSALAWGAIACLAHAAATILVGT